MLSLPCWLQKVLGLFYFSPVNSPSRRYYSAPNYQSCVCALGTGVLALQMFWILPILHRGLTTGRSSACRASMNILVSFGTGTAPHLTRSQFMAFAFTITTYRKRQ